MTVLHPAIGILGGTFDPIHFGHLRMALELAQALALAEVRLVPCYQPVHRAPPIATAEQRLAMIKEAIQKESCLQWDDSEIIRQGPSYTVDTLETLRETFSSTPLCLIMGIDALLYFTQWHRADDILQMAHLVIAHRPNYQLPIEGSVYDLLKTRLTRQKEDLHKQDAGLIFLHPVTALEISATEIRNQIAKGESPRYLLPNSVYDFIQHHQIYV